MQLPICSVQLKASRHLNLSQLLSHQQKMTKKKKTFRSKLEESVADILDKVGAKYEYENQQVAYTIQHHYNPDFCLVNGVMLETRLLGRRR